MKRLKKILKWTGIVLLLLISGLLITVYSRQNLKFEAPYPDIHASTDSAVIAKGKYLVFGPAHCASCHVSSEETVKIKNGEEIPLAGGLRFDIGIVKLSTPNLTPDPETGIAKLTDPQIARALRYGVGHDGRAMLDFMPFHDASDEDLSAIISYIRTMKPVKREVEKNEYSLMGKAIKAFMLKPVGPTTTPPKSVVADSSPAYGKYLVSTVANCRGCHTPRGMTGEFIGPDFSGGLEFKEKEGTFMSPNLTFDKETGWITAWSEQNFIERFRRGRNYEGSPMPWESFKNMSDNDLKAIYSYLKTVQPVSNKIEKVYTAPIK